MNYIILERFTKSYRAEGGGVSYVFICRVFLV